MTGHSLGSILLKRRLLNQRQLDLALQKQRQQAETSGWRLIGELLLEDGIISRSDLEDALVSQAKLNEVQYLQYTNELRKVDILNLTIDNLSMHELLDQLHSGVVLTPNVDHLMKLQKDAEFLKVYTLADYKVCDSQVLMYASQLLGTPIKEKVSGSDLFPRFCEFHKTNANITIFLLGGAEGVAAKAKRKINQKTHRDIVVGAHSPSFGFEKDEQECLEIIEIINQSRATVLAVGVGAPKQEKWIYKYKHKLPHVKIFMAVGATIDFEAGIIKRAPKWMSNLGIEWLFRIYCDPQRLWKRYLVEDLPFFWLLLKQKFGFYTLPRLEPADRTSRPVNVKVSSHSLLLKKRLTTKA
ncbi:MAG: WecB/TagA/CpsF family glycosyltransferase [Tildeniella nuda ZEHNDER 1965/U140]|jgi:exopolysaccharide biosynthesis WecB/TagA/CpsF family protein|nr:WecB/TagA/CpsF family glycosyltransferase [Tildeniella nuda ZEHNDER 1965/U140]